MDQGNVRGIINVVKRQLSAQFASNNVTDNTALAVARDAGYLTLSRGRYGGRKVTFKGTQLLTEQGQLAEIFGASDSDVADIARNVLVDSASMLTF